MFPAFVFSAFGVLCTFDDSTARDQRNGSNKCPREAAQTGLDYFSLIDAEDNWR